MKGNLAGIYICACAYDSFLNRFKSIDYNPKKTVKRMNQDSKINALTS